MKMLKRGEKIFINIKNKVKYVVKELSSVLNEENNQFIKTNLENVKMEITDFLVSLKKLDLKFKLIQ